MAEEEVEVPQPQVSVIAKPLADAKLTKKVLKVVKKGASAHSLAREPELHSAATAAAGSRGGGRCALLTAPTRAQAH